MGPKRSEGFMAKVKGHPIVLVEWIDSAFETTPWMDAAADPQKYQCSHCRSVGWMLDKDEKRIVLYSDDGTHEDQKPGQIGRLMIIPTGCVTSIKTLVKA